MGAIAAIFTIANHATAPIQTMMDNPLWAMVARDG